MGAEHKTTTDLPDGLQAALGALVARVAQRVFAQDVVTHDKGNDGLDLVTSVDLAMQAALEQELTAVLPGSTVVGEEDYNEHSGEGPVWLVDPLDGTVNFVAQVPVYSVAVVLLIAGAPTLAVVYDVVQGDVYTAEVGQGAWLNGVALHPRAHKARLAVLSSGLLKDFAAHSPKDLGALLGDFKLRNFGSQALHLCYAAAGRVCLVASREAKGWDDLAGALIAQEAGLVYGSYAATPNLRAWDQDQTSLCASRAVFDAYLPLFSRSCAPNDALPLEG